MALHFRIAFPGLSEDVFLRACNRAEAEVKAAINKAVASLMKEAKMGKAKADNDLSDILGDEPATVKGAVKMGTKEKAQAAKAAIEQSKAKHTAKAAAPAKAKAAAPAKANGKAAPTKARSAHGEGKYHFPVGTPERESLKKKVLALVGKKKSVSTKEAAETLGAETWQVRLVSVELEADKAIKREKDGNAFMLKAK